MSQNKNNIVDSVTLVQRDELVCLQIRHPKASALIALQGAQVLEYTPTGAHPVIWLSETAAFKRGQSVRGGIPVCWPWFGDLRRNPAAVQLAIGQESAQTHGWVRDLPWLLDRVDNNDNGVNILLRYPMPAGLAAPWCADVELTLHVHVGDELILQLDATQHGQQSVTISQALHSYFAVSHIDQVRVPSLQQVRYLDTLREWQPCRDDVPLRITSETDRIYQNTPATITLEDSGWQRRIHVHSSDAQAAVVWNPWIEKSRRLSHFADDAYQRMLCIETARVLDDCVVLIPGQTQRMTLRIGQSPL